MMISQPSLMNYGKLEAAQTDHRKKIGSMPQKNYDPALEEVPKEERRIQMKPSTKNQIKGKLHEVKGKVTEKAGKATNNPNLEAEGQNEQLAGTLQKKVGQIEKVLEK